MLPKNLNTNIDETYLPIGLQIQAEFQASDIISTINLERKRIKHFIPEYDGMKILENLLPVENALLEGKESELYQVTNETYKIVKRNLSSVGIRGIWEGGIIAQTTQKPSLDFYDTRRDRFYSNELVPYQGSFGIYNVQLEKKE